MAWSCRTSLLLESNHVVAVRGPKENYFRPSIDVLFCSVAHTYGPRVIGVILTGYLDDGTSGRWTVQCLRSLAIVQAPSDAEQPAMSISTLEFVATDYLMPLAETAPLLVRLSRSAMKVGGQAVAPVE